MKIDFTVHGLSELETALKDLRKEMKGDEKNIVATSLRNAAKDAVLFPMVSAAAQHQETGTLLRSLKVLRHPRPTGWSELFGVGVHKLGQRPRKGQPQDTGLPWYAALVEYGGRGNAGPLRGFMRKSLEENREHFVKIFKNEAGKRIEQKAKKIGNENLQKVAARIRTL